MDEIMREKKNERERERERERKKVNERRVDEAVKLRRERKGER